MIKAVNTFLILVLLSALDGADYKSNGSAATLNYTGYHDKVIAAETFLAKEELVSALVIYEEIFENYDYVFLREYQLATQIAIKLEKDEKAALFLRKGVEAGWTKKSIRKNELLKSWLANEKGETLMLDYDAHFRLFEQGVNDSLSMQVHQMYKRDQKLAFKALFKLSSSAQDKYAEKKFAPHSEIQLKQLLEIIKKVGYPGAKHIGNNIWMSTILSHHNSISKDYVKSDTLYLYLRPKLLEAINKGEMRPVDFAFIEEWRIATMTEPSEVSYGFLEAPFKKDLTKTDSLRAAIGMRSVKLRNELVDIQNKTKIEMYLFGSSWVDGKIELR